MKFDVLTLFPEMITAVLGESIIGRAQKAGKVEINTVNIRDFTLDKHRKVDDTPYSGGGGMLMTPQPIYDAYKSVCEKGEKPLTIYMSPQGHIFNQKTAVRLAREFNHIVILCGHYEGIDQRVLDKIVDMEISIGDFVVTGGEIPAMAVIDTITRLLPGVLSSESSYENESHFKGLLEYPQYTKPQIWEGMEIPEILLSGHHANIEKWKHEQSLINTKNKRPDMLENAVLTEDDKEFLKKQSDLRRDT